MSVLDERAEKFKQIVEQAKSQNKEFKIVFTQVDPDALGSAIGLFYILEHCFEVRAEIFYCGKISHPQNKHIFEKYKYALNRLVKPISKMNNNNNGIVFLVDSCSFKDERLPENIKLDNVQVIIDHHLDEDLPKETEQTFIWVEDVGAASTLVVELMQQLKLNIKDDDQWVAILLALGIYTDSKALISSSNRDRAAYEKMAELFSSSEMTQLIKYPIPESYFKHLLFALQTMNHEGPYIVAGLGSVDPTEADDISTIADYLIRMEGITLVLVWGLIEDTVRISTRSFGASFSLDEYMKEKFGQAAGAKITPDGRGEGGARLEFKLGMWLTPSTKDEIYKVVQTRLNEIVFKTSF